MLRLEWMKRAKQVERPWRMAWLEPAGRMPWMKCTKRKNPYHDASVTHLAYGNGVRRLPGIVRFRVSKYIPAGAKYHIMRQVRRLVKNKNGGIPPFFR